MVETAVGWGWALVAAYTVAGVLFAVPFVARWAGRLDESARTGSWGFRVVTLPGVIALWPVLARKVWRMRKGNYEPPVAEKPVTPRQLRKVHRRSMAVLAVLIPVMGATALVLRPPVTPATPEAEGTVFPKVLDGPKVSQTMAGDDGLAAMVELRVKGQAAQVVLKLSTAPKDPVIALYWSTSPTGVELPKDAVYLGPVWGPANLTYALPPEAATQHGSLYFLNLTNGQKLLAVTPLEGK